MNGVFISELQQTLLTFLAAFKQSWALTQHVKEIRSFRMRGELFTWKAWAMAQVLSSFDCQCPRQSRRRANTEVESGENLSTGHRMLPQPICKLSICKMQFCGLTRRSGSELPTWISKNSPIWWVGMELNFFKLLFWNNFGFIEELQRWYREFPYLFHSVSSNVYILHRHAFIKTKKVTCTMLLIKQLALLF